MEERSEELRPLLKNKRLGWMRMAMHEFCLNCFKLKGDYDVCPHCGFIEGTPPEQLYHLHPGIILAERYIVGTVVGFGGFGVTYKAYDVTLNTIIALKEFFPNGLVSRVPGETHIVVFSGEKREHFAQSLQRFLEEARNMAKFNSDPHIINVFNFFEENNTAYIVMEFLDGTSLKEFLALNNGQLDPETALEIIRPITDALEQIHAQGIIHRDISPDNIFITVDHKYKLLDFGAARFSTGDEEKTMSVVIKVGYAAPEQYRSKSKQGNYTDIYALGATLYHLITGIKPDESVDRQTEDTLKRPSQLGLNTGANLEKSIMKALAIKPELRFQKVAELRDALYNDRTVDYPEVELKKRKRRRLLITSLLGAGMLALCAAMIIYFTSIRPGMGLDPAAMTADSITLWVPVSGNKAAQSLQLGLYQSIVTEFEKEYSAKDTPKFQVELLAVPVAEYEERMREATANRNMPTLFRSDIAAASTEDVASLKLLLLSLNPSEYILWDQYETGYPSQTKIPLGFQPVVTYVNQMVVAELKPTEGLLTVVANDAGKGSFYLNHDRYADLVRLNDPELLDHGQINVSQKTIEAMTGIKRAYQLQGFDQHTSGFALLAQDQLMYLMEATSLFREVQKALPGYYEVQPLEINGHMAGRFTNEWSVSAQATKNQQEIAMLFISFLLSDSAQNHLHIQNDNSLPLNQRTFETYLSLNREFQFLQDDLDKFDLAGEGEQVLLEFNDYMVNSVILPDVDINAIGGILSEFQPLTSDGGAVK
jgi:serine/threonine protein kinase